MSEIYNNSLAENKVLILYTLNNIKREILNNDLFKLISSVNNINYFYFGDILEDLVASKLIATYTKDDQKFYQITSEGENFLELTLDILPGIIKLKADNIFQKELSNIAKEQSITAEFIPEDEKNYTVKCKIVENNRTVFEVQTFAGSNEQAKLIADNWKENANELYPKILNLLTEKK